MEPTILSQEQYIAVHTMMVFTQACMLASFLFFALAKGTLGNRYQFALIISALVVGVAGFFYYMILTNWEMAFESVNGEYVKNNIPLIHIYRYADWILTVPLLLVELVAVFALPKAQSRSITTRLAVAAILMIAFGYPGEVAESNAVRAIWGIIATIPFLYIIYVLWFELNDAIVRQAERIKLLFRNLRLLTIGAWGFYPIAYMAPFLDTSPANTLIILQVGYCISDIMAKCGYGVLIYAIARLKTDGDNVVIEGLYHSNV